MGLLPAFLPRPLLLPLLPLPLPLLLAFAAPGPVAAARFFPGGGFEEAAAGAGRRLVESRGCRCGPPSLLLLLLLLVTSLILNPAMLTAGVFLLNITRGGSIPRDCDEEEEEEEGTASMLCTSEARDATGRLFGWLVKTAFPFRFKTKVLLLPPSPPPPPPPPLLLLLRLLFVP